MNENDKQAEPVAVDHSGLIKRIDAAIERVTQGRGLMSIPADPRSDVDLVLSECKALLQGENPPFWATDFHPAQPVQPAVAQELRYTADRALAECPCCGSLDVGGVHDTVNCYGCGLTVTAPRPLQNAINKWNQRTNKAPAPAGAQPPAVAVNEQFAVLIKKANDQAEHFEREWYLRGDELEALEQVNAQLLEALKELMYARTDKAEGMAEAAIAAAEAAKGGV